MSKKKEEEKEYRKVFPTHMIMTTGRRLLTRCTEVTILDEGKDSEMYTIRFALPNGDTYTDTIKKDALDGKN